LQVRTPRKLISFALAFAIILLVACGQSEGSDPSQQTAEATTTPPPAEVSFLAAFKPQANLPFVGAYVAQEQGFFSEQNLEVDINHVTQAGEAFRLLLAGEADFTTADAAVVLERRASDPSLPVVAVALIGQRGQQGFGVLGNSGIESPKDWEGKTVGYKGSKPTPDYLAVLEAAGVDRGRIEEARIGFDVRLLTEGTVDVFPLFLSNEPFTIRKLGFDLRIFEAADYDVPTLGLTYVTTDDYVSEHPDEARRFLKAVLYGIAWAKDHPAEAVEIVMKYAPNEDPEHMRYMLGTELEGAMTEQTEADGIGWMTSEQWRSLHEMLERYEVLTQPLDDPSVAFDDRFLREIYVNGEILWP
jgi:ABC-type nitrate/sulfonate/bicarbonate transport system substrate-binding protein